MSRKTNPEQSAATGREAGPGSVRQADPFFARETAQYDHPLPSR